MTEMSQVWEAIVGPQINLERSSLSDRNGLPLKVTPQRIPVDPEISLSNFFCKLVLCSVKTNADLQIDL